MKCTCTCTKVVRECTKNLCQPHNTVCTSSRTCAVASLECAHGVCNVLTRFVPIHMLYAMCIQASPLGTSNRARTISLVAYIPGEVWGGSWHQHHARALPPRFHAHTTHVASKDFWVRIICHTHISCSCQAAKLVQSVPAPSFPSCQNHFALSLSYKKRRI